MFFLFHSVFLHPLTSVAVVGTYLLGLNYCFLKIFKNKIRFYVIIMGLHFSL